MDSRHGVRNHLGMAFAPCEAVLRDGSACRSAAVTDEPFCSHHSNLAAQIGAEPVRAGDHPRRRRNTTAEPLVADVEAPAIGRNGADPAQVRPRLAEAAAASLDDIQAALLDAALGSVRPVWMTHVCRNCSQKERVEVQVPDVRSRVAAIELLLREGLGRPPQAEEAASPRLPKTAEAIEKLGWDEVNAIFAASFASEIEAVTERGGAELLRERVGALDEDQRQLLRETLDGLTTARSG